jgi:DNA helicase-2/ATP-dependent DNA helicase PcrA
VRENDAAPGTPLLVIAGAGSGKTNTLVHRVAHLIVSGADPRKILLMTFSRRAAAEMARRVERIARRVIGDSAGVMTDALWAGTFHGIGARLLRDYAGEIGLDPAFTIHDREDSADLMNLMRQERVLEDGKPFPGQGHMSRHLFALRQRRVADRGRAGNFLPLVRRLGR